jgi:inosine-uridine nucleoside N-ribohydrolase
VARTFVVDTDTGSDDAVALAMALRHPDVEVAAITVAAGNVPLEQAVQNALYTREVAGGSAPVYAGRSGAAPHTAQDVHGEDGMGDIGLPLSGREPDEGDAVEKLVELVRAAPGEIELVTLGPLTNVGEAFERAPDLAAKLRRLVMMGGTSDAVGNVAPVAEFNIWADPEAARVVFRSGAPIEMVGWDISRAYAVFTPEQSAWLAGLGPVGEFCVAIQAKLVAFTATVTHLAGYDLPDPIAMAVALDPSVATEVRRFHVDVEVAGELTRGQTVVDRLGVGRREPNVDVVLEASREAFERVLAQTLTG